MNNKKRVHKKRRNKIDIIKCIKLLIILILIVLSIYAVANRINEVKNRYNGAFEFLFTTMRQ
ncbi:MAG: hypothetical protein MR691_08265 [Clostridium sp.]|nr:hypothetical protein [Clostridium sp.]